VATVALGKGGAKNAAILATQMIGLKLPEVAARFKRFRAELTRKALEQSRP
jgi:phosphoribosylcarboxyaminoimidazole (NCAIR) mutase